MDSFTKENIISPQQGSYPNICFQLDYRAAERQQFIENELWRRWARKYPLFDSKDLAVVEGQARKMHVHYYEWKAAIELYKETGYKSLIEKYQFGRAHHEKWAIFCSIVPKKLVRMIENKQFGRTQCPDLFVYDTNMNDWFFCEVKGSTDRIRPNQTEFFHAIEALCHKPIRLIRFKE